MYYLRQYIEEDFTKIGGKEGLKEATDEIGIEFLACFDIPKNV